MNVGEVPAQDDNGRTPAGAPWAGDKPQRSIIRRVFGFLLRSR